MFAESRANTNMYRFHRKWNSAGHLEFLMFTKLLSSLCLTYTNLYTKYQRICHHLQLAERDQERSKDAVAVWWLNHGIMSTPVYIHTGDTIIIFNNKCKIVFSFTILFWWYSGPCDEQPPHMWLYIDKRQICLRKMLFWHPIGWLLLAGTTVYQF